MSSRPVPHERVAGAPLVRHPHRHGATHKSQLEKKILEKKQWDMREAVLAVSILASGVWIVVSGLMKAR